MSRSDDVRSCMALQMQETVSSVTGDEVLLMNLEELEERLSMQMAPDGTFCPFCVWYTCPDVCPPGG